MTDRSNPWPVAWTPKLERLFKKLMVGRGSTGLGGSPTLDNLVVDDIKTKSPWVDVTHPDFGAKGDGSADDTEAIQAAIDAATEDDVGKRIVYMPAGHYMISNLTLPPKSILKGDGMWDTYLDRIVGSTGNAIQEDSTISNAAKIVLLDFTLDGKDTDGTGIDLGHESGAWGTQGYIDRVQVRNFTGAGGRGVYIRGNAAMIGHLLVIDCTTTAVELSGAAWQVELIEVVATTGNLTTTAFKISSTHHTINNLYFEGRFTNVVDVNCSFSCFSSITASIADGTTITNLIDIDSADIQNKFDTIITILAGTAAITNIINDNYNSVQVPRKSHIASYDQNAGAPDYSILYSDDTSVTIPSYGSIRTVVMDNLTADKNVALPLLPSGYPVITVVNNSDINNRFVVNINAHGTDAAKKVGGRVAGYPVYAQQSATFKGVDSDIASDKAWVKIGGDATATFTRQIEISSAEMKTLAASPIELVPAPGAGFLIEFLSAVLIYDSAATDYTVQADENMAIRYENGSGTIVSLTVESDGFIKEAASDGIRIVHPIATFQDTDVLGSINKSLVLDNIGSGEWDDGTGTMTVIITWREYYNLGL